jgi:hypothetical protein
VTNILANIIVQQDISTGNNQTQFDKKEMFDSVKSNVMVAGGCLSEIFIQGYDEKPKDVDIFIDINHFVDILLKISNINDTTEIIKNIFNSEFGHFELVKKGDWKRFNYDKVFEIKDIMTGTLNQFPDIKIEIIMVDHIDINFDLSFREFFYNGDYIITNERAMGDIENKTITFNTIESPISSLVRAEEFSKRYKFKIDQHSKEWTIKYLRYVKNDFDEVRKIVKNIGKYGTEFDIEQLQEEVNKIPASKDDDTILGTINTQNYSTNNIFFRNVIERLRYIEKEKIDINKVYEIKIPKLKKRINKIIYDGKISDERIEKKVKDDIFNEFKVMNRTVAIKRMFTNIDQFKNTFANQKRELFNKIQKTHNITTYRSFDAEYLFMLMEEVIAGNRIEKGISYLDLDDESAGYFGTEEKMKSNILAEKMYVRPTFEQYIFRNDNEENLTQFEYTFEERKETLEFQFHFQKNKSLITYDPYKFGYLLNERYEMIQKIMDEGITEQPSSYVDSNKGVFNIDENISEIFYQENYLPDKTVQMINELSDARKELFMKEKDTTIEDDHLPF